MSQSKRVSAEGQTSFTISQAYLGAQLQFEPALGSRELDILINDYVPGPATLQQKRAQVSLDFFNAIEDSALFHPVTRRYHVPTTVRMETQFKTSPSTASLDYGSPAASISSTSRSLKRARQGSKESSSPSSKRLPGFSIMTRDGVDITEYASRGPKTKEQRDHAALMRKLKACGPCKRSKQRCDPSHHRGASSPAATPSSATPSLTSSHSWSRIGSQASISPESSFEDSFNRSPDQKAKAIAHAGEEFPSIAGSQTALSPSDMAFVDTLLADFELGPLALHDLNSQLFPMTDMGADHYATEFVHSVDPADSTMWDVQTTSGPQFLTANSYRQEATGALAVRSSGQSLAGFTTATEHSPTFQITQQTSTDMSPISQLSVNGPQASPIDSGMNEWAPPGLESNESVVSGLQREPTISNLPREASSTSHVFPTATDFQENDLVLYPESPRGSRATDSGGSLSTAAVFNSQSSVSSPTLSSALEFDGLQFQQSSEAGLLQSAAYTFNRLSSEVNARSIDGGDRTFDQPRFIVKKSLQSSSSLLHAYEESILAKLPGDTEHQTREQGLMSSTSLNTTNIPHRINITSSQGPLTSTDTINVTSNHVCTEVDSRPLAQAQATIASERSEGEHRVEGSESAGGLNRLRRHSDVRHFQTLHSRDSVQRSDEVVHHDYPRYDARSTSSDNLSVSTHGYWTLSLQETNRYDDEIRKKSTGLQYTAVGVLRDIVSQQIDIPRMTSASQTMAAGLHMIRTIRKLSAQNQVASLNLTDMSLLDTTCTREPYLRTNRPTTSSSIIEQAAYMMKLIVMFTMSFAICAGNIPAQLLIYSAMAVVVIAATYLSTERSITSILSFATAFDSRSSVGKTKRLVLDMVSNLEISSFKEGSRQHLSSSIPKDIQAVPTISSRPKLSPHSTHDHIKPVPGYPISFCRSSRRNVFSKLGSMLTRSYNSLSPTKLIVIRAG